MVEWDDPAFEEWIERMGKGAVMGVRAVVVLDVWKVDFPGSLSTSAMPLLISCFCNAQCRLRNPWISSIFLVSSALGYSQPSRSKHPAASEYPR